MMRAIPTLALLLALPAPALADALVAARILRSGTVLTAADLRIDPQIDGTLTDPLSVIGHELRVMVSEGRVIEPAFLAAPTLVARNQLVTIAYENAALRIEAEGRALSAGAAGDVIRVMNNASRTTLSGRIAPDGTVIVARN